MRTNLRLAAGLCLLGSAACAASAPVVPRVEPGSVIESDEALRESYDGRSPMFIIRAAKTPELAALQPLYYMDGERVGGVPYLRPNDIAHVEVVTGQDAVSRYGVAPDRAVVLVTTKWAQARRRS